MNYRRYCIFYSTLYALLPLTLAAVKIQRIGNSGVLTQPISDFLFAQLAINPTIIDSTRHYLRGEARLANTSCASAANAVKLLTGDMIQTVCWYKGDHEELFNRLPASYRHVKFLICDNDCSHNPEDAIVVAKSRSIEQLSSRRTSTVLPLNTPRHFKNIGPALKDPVSFHRKLPIAIWRGSSSSSCWEHFPNISADHTPRSEECARRNLVSRWSRSTHTAVDVGLTRLVQQATHFAEVYEPMVKEEIPWRDMLKYRYIVSVEGNDVASNLKWALASKSVVLMPIPSRESFALESKLKPWVHYVPLSYDTSDLIEKLSYCEMNSGVCEQISIRATYWVRSLVDMDQVYELGARVLKEHLDRIFIAAS